jgi:diguanylate cyclase (GGDEF)-like protein
MNRSFAALTQTYYELVRSMVPACTGISILDGDLRPHGVGGAFDTAGFLPWLRSRGWKEGKAIGSHATRLKSTHSIEAALPLTDSTGCLIAALCLAVKVDAPADAHAGKALRARLKPALDCLHREVAAAERATSKVADLTDRTQDLEWLFDIAGDLGAASSTDELLQQLLRKVTPRMNSALCAVVVPEQHLSIQFAAAGGAALSGALQQIQGHLLSWAQRKRKPLVLNGVGKQAANIARCKVLSVPILQGRTQAIGVLVFVNPPEADDFVTRQSFLAAHIARHVTNLLQTQFDLATGLYTRAALAQMYESMTDADKGSRQSVLLIDIDQLHVINEVHGYEAGDALILRLANMLAPPILPQRALTGRLSGDRFIVVLPDMDLADTTAIASRLQDTIRSVPVGPQDSGIEPTLSCGLTSMSSGPGGFKRALAAAETACQAAKDHGRNRIETFACDDSSIIQRHGDVFLVGALREALKNDQFVLYAQPITPLRNPELPSSFEILLRLRQPDGSIVSPGDFLPAAQRYQLLPAIDLWVLDHTLDILAKHLRLMRSRNLSVSLNLTGSSLGDARFADQLVARLKSSRVPPGFINIEVTEQAAMRNLACAVRMMNSLRALGCGVALDDFGTGTNSLSYLRDLPVTRVKIDGSFVRDILTNRRSEQTIRAIMQLLKAFPVDTVAEYVETQDIARKLRTIGVDYGQGYAFGKPADFAATLAELERDESRRMHALALEI